MVTIYDIAKKTGFSAPTVSKALNGTGNLNPETREIIIAEAKNMGYKPNLTARSLITKKSNLVGVIFEDFGLLEGLGHPLFSGILDSFRKVMQENGYDLIFLSKKQGKNIISYAEHCANRNIEGVLIVSNDCIQEELDLLIKSNIPCVSINDSIFGAPIVISENYYSAYKAVDYFVSMGHQNIGFLGVINETEREHAPVNRENGFRKALKDNNIEVSNKQIEICKNWQQKSGYEGMKNLYSRNKKLTAIFASSDILALGAIEYLKEINIHVPQDISIIGFDNDRITEYSNPPLTTFAQDTDSIGKKAAEILLKKINGEGVPDMIQIPTQLIVRESVKSLL